MNHERFRLLLDDYLDGELAPAARKRVEAHLEACEECTAELASLTELTAAARGLPREILPPRDLWSAIEARLQERGPQAPRLPHGRMPWARPWMMAAAALLLVALSSAVTLALVRQQPAASAGAGAAATTPWRAPEGSALAAFEPTGAEFERTADELRQMLEIGRTMLLPETVATVEASLAVIDQAIEEAREALRTDPNNRALTLLLAGVYREKVELLQRALQFELRS